jgi:hypothetical protein
MLESNLGMLTDGRNGDLSSCDASETKRLWRAWPASSRSSILFMVVAKRAISSVPWGPRTRRWSSSVEIASTSARIDSTGARARPATLQVTAPTNSRRRGAPTSSRVPTTSVDSSTSSKVRPTTIE